MEFRPILWSILVMFPIYQSVATGQDLAVSLPSAPSGFDETSTLGLPALDDIARQLSFGMTTSMVYDSNFSRSPDNAPGGKQDEVTLTVSPFLTYQRAGTVWSLSATAGLNYNSYFENSDNNGLGYNTVIDVGYHGGPLSINGSFTSSYTQGVNRYYDNNFVQTLNFGLSVGASYVLSPKTSISSSVSYNWSEASGGGTSAQTGTSATIAAHWQATPLLTIGPGLGWSMQTGGTQPDRESLGPIVAVKYKLTEKIKFDGTFGVEFVEEGGSGSSDASFTTRLGLSYNPSLLWGLNFSVFRGTSADPFVNGAFRESTSYRFGYHRKIRVVTFNLGTSYVTDEYSGSTVAASTQDDREFLNYDLSLSMPILQNRANISTFFVWQKETGASNGDWDGYQVGLKISTNF